MRYLLITGAAQPTESLLEELRQFGWTVHFHQQEKDSVASPELYDCVICNGLFLYNDITNFKNLKTIHLTSAGLDRVPIEYINDKGIRLFNARGVYSVPMAEWALGVILNHYRRLSEFGIQQTNLQWNKIRDLSELYGKYVAIIGAGNIGNEVAKRLQAFEAIVTGFDMKPFSNPNFSKILSFSEFDPEYYDIIILTLPHTHQTHHIINKDIIKKIKTGSLLINMSRGGLIDEKALEDVLNERIDITAILDVFEEEPLPITSVLWNMPNVKISPHNSFIGENNVNRLHKVILKNLGDL